MKTMMEMTSPEFKLAVEKSQTIVISCASIEPHGPHLPLGADSYQGERAVSDVAKKMTEKGISTIAGPVIPFGLLTNQFERSRPDPGNVNISSDTLKGILIDTTKSLMRDGISQFVWVMSHVENESLMHVAAKELYEEYGAKVVVLNWIQHVMSIYPEVLKGNHVQGHAGEGETSRMMAIKPDLVRVEGLDSYYQAYEEKPNFSGLPYFSGGVGIFFPVENDESPGYIGEPHLSNAADGEIMLDSMANWMADVAVYYFSKQLSK